MTFPGRMFSSFLFYAERVRAIRILKSPVHSIKKRANYLLNPLVKRSTFDQLIVLSPFVPAFTVE